MCSVLTVQEDTPEWRSSYTSSTLVIMRFMSDFQGNYTCVASNAFRMKKQTFYLSGKKELTVDIGVALTLTWIGTWVHFTKPNQTQGVLSMQANATTRI